ncbi:hypothetical protein IWX90DRAFT_20093 [Phyllosticta citrichinensis]|uniref:Uncharacterized protein n=1 Tax=Phyllosticta citrichinensis TaxID=1130410 RepID=A0ABR1Y6H1_9PEZI
MEERCLKTDGPGQACQTRRSFWAFRALGAAHVRLKAHGVEVRVCKAVPRTRIGLAVNATHRSCTFLDEADGDTVRQTGLCLDGIRAQQHWSLCATLASFQGFRLLSPALSNEAQQVQQHSGLTFVDNSKGALEAIEEVSQVLDETFKEIDFEGSLSERLDKYQTRLNEEAEKYANSSIDSCHTKNRWTCDNHEGDLISIAWKCSAGTHDSSYATELQDYQFRL